jgi:WD40 repeat protein/GTPase SAR1 family protein
VAFEYDVFLSSSRADKDIVSALAVRLQTAGLRVFDPWNADAGSDILRVSHSALKAAATLVLCVSQDALGAEWPDLEAGTYRFRDPSMPSRRLILLRLEDGLRLPGGLESALTVDWLRESEAELRRLVAACFPIAEADTHPPAWPATSVVLAVGHAVTVEAAAVHDGWAFTGDVRGTVRLWNLRTGNSRVGLGRHTAPVSATAFSADGTHAASGDRAGVVRIWNLARACCVATLIERHASEAVGAVVFTQDGRRVVSGDAVGVLRVWDVAAQKLTATFDAHEGAVAALAITNDGARIISTGEDGVVRLLDLASGHDHALGTTTQPVLSLCVESERSVLTGGADGTLRRWYLHEDAGAEAEIVFESRASIDLVVVDSATKTVLVVTSDQDIFVVDESDTLRSSRRLEAEHLVLEALALDLATDVVLMAKAGGDIRLYGAHTGEWRTPLLGDVVGRRLAAFDYVGARAVTTPVERDDAVDGQILEIWDARHSGLEHVVPLDTYLTAVAVAPGGRTAIGGTKAGRTFHFDLESGTRRLLGLHAGEVCAIAFSADGRLAVSVANSAELIVWDVEAGIAHATLMLDGQITTVGFDSSGARLLVAQQDGTLMVAERESGGRERLTGHSEAVTAVAFSPDDRRALSGSADLTVRLWDIASGKCPWVLEGHSRPISSVAFHPTADKAVSADTGGKVRLWDLNAGECERVLESGEQDLQQVAFASDGQTIMAFGSTGQLATWPMSGATSRASAAEQITYTNAKVVLVGESQAGKSGLAMRLAYDRWEHTESTLGAWATQLPLPMDNGRGSREIWLWDFGGQADQRLIHQLYLQDAALAVLVFDGQRDDVLTRLWDWDRALPPDGDAPKLLVAGRTDRYKVRLSQVQIDEFCEAAGYRGYIETSAKTDVGCDTLRSAIVESIDWDRLPWRTSPRVFQLLKEQILRMKDEGRALITVKELRDWLPTQVGAFEPAELDAVIGLLAGPGAVMPLGFGDYILLQPELINAYAQAVIETLRDDPLERGCIAEARVRDGNLNYPDGFQRLPEAEEGIVLRAMHRQLVDRSLCLRDHDSRDRRATLLVFPSYFRRQRPERPGTPTAFMTYRFQGRIDEIYAGLVVRLHYTDPLDSSDLWRDAADFRTINGLTLGVRLQRLPDGDGLIELHCDPATEMTDQVVFARYVDDHLRARARQLTRLRTYICPKCSTPVENREAALRRLENGKDDIGCAMCDARIPLVDEIEEHLGDPAVLARIRQMRDEADASLHSDSKELLLVAEVLARARQADQIARDKPVGDWGIDAEIEFRNNAGKASGRMVFLQLKSGKSHIEQRKDGRRIFRIYDPRHAEYWADQAFPVMLVTRDEHGRIEWMEIREPLRRLREEDPNWPVKQLVFHGQELDLMAIRRWREDELRG